MTKKKKEKKLQDVIQLTAPFHLHNNSHTCPAGPWTSVRVLTSCVCGVSGLWPLGFQQEKWGTLWSWTHQWRAARIKDPPVEHRICPSHHSTDPRPAHMRDRWGYVCLPGFHTPLGTRTWTWMLMLQLCFFHLMTMLWLTRSAMIYSDENSSHHCAANSFMTLLYQRAHFGCQINSFPELSHSLFHGGGKIFQTRKVSRSSRNASHWQWRKRGISLLAIWACNITLLSML